MVWWMYLMIKLEYYSSLNAVAMAEPKVDFFVIYNRAMSPQAETEDCHLSLNFTEHLVRVLEERGHKGHYADRDAIGGTNIFKELFRNIRETRKTVLVVTPEFLKNCWAAYSSMAAFKEIIDTNKCDKLIPIGIGILDHQKLQELNIKEWIHLSKDWSSEKNARQWNVILKSISHDGPLATEASFQEYIHAQEHCDNKLRSDHDILVVQPDSLQTQDTDFFNEKFLLNFAKHFITDWQILALNLGLKDETIREVELNYYKNVRLQAYNALLRWKNASGFKQKKRFTELMSVLMDMGRKDLAEDIETKYNEFVSQNESTNEGLDEVDMGISRKKNDNLYLQKTQQKTFDMSEHQLYERMNNAGDSTQNKTYMTRELKPETTAFIEMKPNSASQISTLDSLALQPGPSMSLPPAPLLSLPQSKSTKGLPNNAVDKQQTDKKVTVNTQGNSNIDRVAGGDDLNDETHSNTGGPEAMEYIPVEEHILSSQTGNLNQQIRMSDTQEEDKTQDGWNGISNTDVEGKLKYTCQQSLSKDIDLSADAYGSFAFDKTTKSLHFHSSENNAHPSNHLSNNQTDTENASPDSGYSCSVAQTPLDDQIILNIGNQSEDAVQANKQKIETNPETASKMSAKQACEGSKESKDAQITENSTKSEKSANAHPNESDGQYNMSKNIRSELDTSFSSTQGQPQSLGSKVLYSFVSWLTRPELAYS